jgi:hypothetical protein
MLRKLFFLCLLALAGYYIYNRYWKPEADTALDTTVIHNTIVEKVEAMGKLELVKYQMKDVVEYKITQPALIPDSKAMVLVSGEAVGCIDLTRIDSSSVSIAGDTVYVKLPQPEICYYKVDHDQSKVISTSFTYMKEAQLIDAAYKEAEVQMMHAAEQMDILEQTRRNAQLMLKPMLEAVSGRTVILTYELPHQKLEAVK